MKNARIYAAAIIIIALVAVALLQALYPARKTFNDITTERVAVRLSDVFYDYEITRYPSAAEVVELRNENTLIGFDVSPDRLSFGIVPANGSFARKVINLTNSAGKSAKVYLDASGEIAGYITFDTADFVLEPRQMKEVSVTFSTQNNNLSAPAGNYTGEIDIIIQIPKYDFIYSIWT